MLDRRQLLSLIAATGIGSAAFHGAVAGLAQEDSFDAELLKKAEWISGIELSDEEREALVESVRKNHDVNAALRTVEIPADVAPAIYFQPVTCPDKSDRVDRNMNTIADSADAMPGTDDAIAFLPVHRLAGLVRTGKLSSVRLTNIYLERLKKYGPMLRCVITLTEELALKQAAQADKEIAEGNYRGPLHGIPWGAKDLISVPGYPTSWGIPYLKNQQLDTAATVVERLQEAGAVLVAKLSLGALAMGDKWFGGMTRNPWNPRRGSSGSSAGSAAATVAGLVGFTLGSETLGSILSPCIRCGSTGLRPTFGRVSRFGCMPLSWSMDKIGPICRSVEDCALVFGAIHGADGRDPTAQNYAFQWPSESDFKGLRVGVLKLNEELKDAESGQSENSVEEDKQNAGQAGSEAGNNQQEAQQQNQQQEKRQQGQQQGPQEEEQQAQVDVQQILKDLGCELVKLELPGDVPLSALTSIIDIEGASVFDSMLRGGHTDGWNQWTKIFQAAELISGVDYLRYQRIRTQLMRKFEEAIKDVDVLFNMQDLVHTNFTGHPSVVMPVGYRERRGGQSVIPAVFTGHLHDDQRLLALAHAFQQKVAAHLQQPPVDDWLEKFEAGELDEKKEEVESDS